MSLSPSDERTLILPLFAGLQQTAGWDTFLRRLLTRTGATRVCLLQRPSGASGGEALQREARANDAASQTPLNLDALEACGLMPLGALRPERVYALEEMLAPPESPNGKQQRKVMAGQHIAHARFVRFAPGTEADSWLIIIHGRNDFTAADSALLSSVIPYLGVAITTLTQILVLQLRAAIAEEALGLLGVGQAVLDREGRVITGDAIAMSALPRPGELAPACAEVAGKPTAARAIAMSDPPVLLRPARTFGGVSPRLAAATALVRIPVRRDVTRMAHIVARRFGLSAREAALAAALASGKSLIEAKLG